MQSGPDLTWYALHFLNGLIPYASAAVGITLISVTPLGRAAISWLKGHVNRGRAAELATALEQLRLELGEMQERLDFTERQLLNVSSAQPPQLPKQRTPPEAQTRVKTPV